MPGFLSDTQWDNAKKALEEEKEKKLRPHHLSKVSRKIATTRDLGPFSFFQMPNSEPHFLYPGKANKVFHTADQQTVAGKIAGVGGFSRVKYCFNKAGVRHTVKIDSCEALGSSRVQQAGKEETKISLDVGFFLDVGYRYKERDHKKRSYQGYYRYALMEDHGKPLNQYLASEKPHLSDDQRLKLGFQACLQVDLLEQGHKTKSGRGVAHYDIKPGNFYIKNDVLTLGDYGLSDYADNKTRCSATKGTPNYIPSEGTCGTNAFYLDCFALKRCLDFPLRRKIYDYGYVSSPERRNDAIFTDAMLSRLPALKAMASNDFAHTTANSPLALAAGIAIVSVLKDKTTTSPKTLSIICMETICLLYQCQHLSKASLERALADSRYCERLAKLYPLIELLTPALLAKALTEDYCYLDLGRLAEQDRDTRKAGIAELMKQPAAGATGTDDDRRELNSAIGLRLS